MSYQFSVVTPSFNAYRWIRPCIASVADQEGTSVEHIVQDGLSTDGTAEYLLSEPLVRAESSKDKGMYDAINKAWAKCSGEYVLHLNADEQLLPGALKTVSAYFEAHPDIDLLIAGSLICEKDGSLHCYRKPLLPSLGFITTSHLPVHTCSIFMRRSSFSERKWLYDPEFKHVSDALFMIDALRDGKKIGILDTYTSVFFLTGANIGLSGSERYDREAAYVATQASALQKALRPLIKAQFRLRKLLTGHYSQGPLSYDVYLPEHTEQREHISVSKPSGIYRPQQTSEASV
jgi:glycosyltransferase involved in cell wall biosynthesis